MDFEEVLLQEVMMVAAAYLAIMPATIAREAGLLGVAALAVNTALALLMIRVALDPSLARRLASNPRTLYVVLAAGLASTILMVLGEKWAAGGCEKTVWAYEAITVG